MSDKKIDLTSTALEKGIDLVKGFVEKLVGSTLEETGLLLGDNVRLYRLKNQIKMLIKAQEICKENNISLKQISLKTLVPLLEYSSLENDESIQQKWANMLVNFIDAKEIYESSIFPFILNQLSSNELLILNEIYKYPNSVNSFDFSYLDISFSNLEKANLLRLGLIEVGFITSSKRQSEKTGARLFKGNLCDISELGIAFINCCSSR